MSKWYIAGGTILFAIAVMHCEREGSESSRPSRAPRPNAVASAENRPPPEENWILEVAATVPRPRGEPGEVVEGDTYSFKVLSVRPCENRNDVAPTAARSAKEGTQQSGPIVIGALVEITAKTSLSISPRDVQLTSGGIHFYASMDQQRKLSGCTPLLRRSMLKKGRAVKGFVLFDVPLPEPPHLELAYQPTRWGGASRVSIAVADCISCRERATNTGIAKR